MPVVSADLPERATLSSYSVADLGHGVRGTLDFLGRHALPAGSAGFVRSEARARAAVTQSAQPALPWRDYPAYILTSHTRILTRPYEEDFLLVGCRNVLNEWGYQVRLLGRWWRRGGDPAVDDRWPVLATLPDGVRFLRAADADKTAADILTGLPLVIRGRASSLNFLIANCSDVAHVFEVHPEGLLGPSAEAWHELSNLWQTARDEGRDESELAATMLAAARRLGVEPNRDNLHSMIAETRDGSVFVFAISGALDSIARHLVKRWKVFNAILLDNGGSVGWFYCPKGGNKPAFLLAGPNHRENGTAFLALETHGFPRPRGHACLTDWKRDRV
jgi:hypothetical protein